MMSRVIRNTERHFVIVQPFPLLRTSEVLECILTHDNGSSFPDKSKRLLGDVKYDLHINNVTVTPRQCERLIAWLDRAARSI